MEAWNETIAPTGADSTGREPKMADDPMMQEHLTTWHYFCGLLKWSLILIVSSCWP